jgi:hypothetical protein
MVRKLSSKLDQKGQDQRTLQQARFTYWHGQETLQQADFTIVEVSEPDTRLDVP